jgi:hypothetical protein
MLVEVKCFGGFDETPILDMNTGLVDRCYAAKLIVGEVVDTAAKVSS